MKAFQFFHLQDKANFKSDLAEHQTEPPKELAWRTFGVAPVDTRYPDEEERFVGSINNREKHIDVVIVERILPSAYIKKSVRELAENHLIATGETATRAMKAQWTEDFLNEHLPNAPLKETKIRVCIFDGTNMVVGTSSQKQADDVVSFVRHKLFEEPVVAKPTNSELFGQWLSTFLYNNTDFNDFNSGSSCKIYSASTERKISFTNDGGLYLAHETLVGSGGQSVTEMNMWNDDVGYTFTLTEKAVGKSLKVLLTQDREEEFEAAKSSQDVVLRAQTEWHFLFDAIGSIHSLFNLIENGGGDDDL